MSLLDNASLLLTPNAYKESKLYSVIPSNGNGDFTATRATTATRVNAAGLVDLVPYNFLEYTTTFLGWTQNGFISSGHPDPFGGNSARLYQFSSSTDRIALAIPITAGVTYTLSAWIKGVNLTDFRMLLGTNQQVDVYPQIINGQWVRVIATVTATTTGSYQQSPARANSSNVQSFYFYGPQLVEGTVPRDYYPTTTRLNIPRVDYSLGGCPNILLEPQRTNLALQSSSFDSASWAKTQVSVTSNSTTSPSGVVDADKLITDNGSLFAAGFISQGSTKAASAITYTYSCFAKTSGFNGIKLFLRGASGNADNAQATYNISNGTFIATATSQGTFTNASATITAYPNGWYYCTLTCTSDTQTGITTRIFVADTVQTTGDGVNGIFIWGAQLEAGAYATSYIPTTTASVTRNADVIEKTGISSLIGQTEGTLFADVNIRQTGTTNRIITINDGTAFGNISMLTFSPLNRFQYEATPINIFTGSYPAGRYKVAVVYSADGASIWVNGSEVATTSTATTTTGYTKLFLGTSPYGVGEYKGVNYAAIWTTRLTNDQLATLTTL